MPNEHYVNLKDADIELVELRDSSFKQNCRKTPHCKLHGAMNKLTRSGIWRCVTTYEVTGPPNNLRVKYNNCKAGCQESGR